ncbi:MAG: PEP-CTERM sorting domain-containing protein [Gammaproteobacteria bacterium]|nr:PEP-CTERM sorting domain-containing protein [Rhodocyclaceae bacterium]MBU3907591.1 PEP-CTERM sorting domain-containing protein [Gammaproteobacteria bacterium]MBU4004237.1 PEP-CTERM sorting domain-containing protein [Gammaproteobacteria bacterium]MBU4019646.1 PEP-CTERM sorting domain-containing protein [Gammaproteobacteria bacterium]MBU4095045.1 PEP-CTERM sorting domain-containing protein [Gammaproteobacteria bacterium]
MGHGEQSFNYTFNYIKYSAWAVRPGDVAAVSEPETYALMLAGLGLLGVITRRAKRR